MNSAHSFTEGMDVPEESKGILSKKDDGTWDYKIINEWQLCPKCEGIGIMTVMYPGYVINQTATCDVCNGKKIISKVDGNPPQ